MSWFVYDPNHTLSYGYWKCPTCNAAFYGGGEAAHEKDCSVREQGYAACTYHFGPKEVEKIKEYSMTFGNDGGPITSAITMADLKKHFPQLVS